VITQDWTPAQPPARSGGALTEHERALRAATRAATGQVANGHGDLNIMEVPY
jgi:hypothetical protein